MLKYESSLVSCVEYSSHSFIYLFIYLSIHSFIFLLTENWFSGRVWYKVWGHGSSWLGKRKTVFEITCSTIHSLYGGLTGRKGSQLLTYFWYYSIGAALLNTLNLHKQPLAGYMHTKSEVMDCTCGLFKPRGLIPPFFFLISKVQVTLFTVLVYFAIMFFWDAVLRLIIRKM